MAADGKHGLPQSKTKLRAPKSYAQSVKRRLTAKVTGRASSPIERKRLAVPLTAELDDILHEVRR